MAELATLQRFSELVGEGYIPSVGAWVQVDPAAGLTTILNAFNTLGTQTAEMYLFDRTGELVAPAYVVTIETGHTLRLDLETLIPANKLPYEGNLWLFAHGDTTEGHIGLQAVDLDFIDRNRPEGHVLGSVHLIFDFVNTLGLPPYLDLVSPRVIAALTPEGAPQFMNYLGLAHVPVDVTVLALADLEVSVTNAAGETRIAAETLHLPLLGSWFGSLESLFPGLPEFLMIDGAQRGYGAVNVRHKDAERVGLAGMIKVVNMVSGELLVDHLNDRHFARPAMKDPR